MVHDQLSDHKRVLSNTLILCVRMLFIMLIKLYSSRLVLQALGVTDYGIYNIVGSTIIIFSFLSNAMANTGQRYLAYAIGQDNQEKLKSWFSAIRLIHYGLTVVVLILLETIGLWILYKKLNIPPDRAIATLISYQILVISSLITIIRVPYNSVIISHENMKVYAYISIFEAMLALGAAAILFLLPTDALITYALMICIGNYMVYLIYRGYCRHKYQECIVPMWQGMSHVKEISGFAGWTLFGDVAFIGRTQGINILYNLFYGVIVNAAQGIAHQVQMAMTSFMHNFQTALNPYIVKTYASGNQIGTCNVIISSSKLSYYMVCVFALPLIIEFPYIASIWLVEVPEYAITFTRLSLLCSLVGAFRSPLRAGALASGKVKYYQIFTSIVLLLNLPISYVVLKFGNHATALYWVLVIAIILMTVAELVSVFILHKIIGMPVWKYIWKVFIPVTIVTLLSFALLYFIHIRMSMGFIRLCAILAAGFACVLGLAYLIGIDKKERGFINNCIGNFFKKYRDSSDENLDIFCHS